MAMTDRMDRDNDGAVLDDVFSGGINLAGGVLGATGATLAGLSMAAGTTAGIEAMTGIGIPAAAVTALGGAGVGIAGVGATAAGMLLSTTTAATAAEEVGDFTSDLLGTRSTPPYTHAEDGDPHY